MKYYEGTKITLIKNFNNIMTKMKKKTGYKYKELYHLYKSYLKHNKNTLKW